MFPQHSTGVASDFMVPKGKTTQEDIEGCDAACLKEGNALIFILHVTFVDDLRIYVFVHRDHF